jgi:hypothetical protein
VFWAGVLVASLAASAAAYHRVDIPPNDGCAGSARPSA